MKNMATKKEKAYREQYGYDDDEEIDEDDFIVWCASGYSQHNDQE